MTVPKALSAITGLIRSMIKVPAIDSIASSSLTQVEAERRAALLVVDRYDIDVDLSALPTGSKVRCVSTITFACRAPGGETFVDCAADVVSATLNGVALDTPGGDRVRLTGLTAQNTLRVESVQSNTADGPGVHKAIDPGDGEVYVWFSFEPDEARYVWACFDQPDLKAPHAFTVTAPREWTVLSNSGEPQIEDVGAERRWSFPDTPRLSGYNTVINAGPLHEIRREAGGYDLGVFARRSLGPLLQRDADEIFAVTEQGLRFFGDAFGMPFPQSKYDQVFMPEYGGAMENYGCVTWSDVFLRRANPTPAESQSLALTLLHELAHMWLGNIVTMKWWDDLWLNEAFAEFAAHWAAVSATKYTDAWAGHLASGKLAAYLADQGPISHPIRQPIHDVAEAASIFDPITYPKGASVLAQLMAYVGEANFSAGMTAYFARHTWGSTTLQDLIDALAVASGRDLDAWRSGWLDTAGTDRLTLEPDGEGLVLVARGPAGPPRPHLLAVGAYRGDGDGLRCTALAEVEVQQERTPVTVPAGAELYLVNDGDFTFATTRPDANTRDALFNAAARLPSAISRGVAVATAWDMLINGEATAAEVLTCLTGVLAAETCDSVVEPYLKLAVEIAELWAPSVDRPALTATMAATCRALAQHENRRQVALRALAGVTTDLDDLAWVLRQAGKEVDLRWRALVGAARLGGDTASDVTALLELDADPDAWTRALAVRAAAPDAEAKEEVWRALIIEHQVPIAAVNEVTAAFWRPDQDDLLAPYAERYVEMLPDMHRAGMIPALVFANRLFPLFGIEESFIDRAMAASAHTAPVVSRTLLERADRVRRMLRSRQLRPGTPGM